MLKNLITNNLKNNNNVTDEDMEESNIVWNKTFRKQKLTSENKN